MKKNVKPLQILPIAYQNETPNMAIPKKKVAPTAIPVKKAPLKLWTSASLSVFLYLHVLNEGNSSVYHVLNLYTTIMLGKL